MTLDHVIQLLLLYKYAILFPIAVVEGPIISILAGFLSSTGQMNIYAAFGIVVAGDLVGDTIYYFLGRLGGQKIIQRYGTRLRISPARVQRLEAHFRDHAGKTLVIGKFSHGLGAIVLFVAGLGKVKYPKFFVYNLFSTLAKSLLLVMVGYYFGYAYQRIDKYLNNAAYIVLGIAIIGGIVYYTGSRLYKKLL